ncbi:MAG: hypothetical protein ABF648_04700, partial [Propionibacterium sp.]
MTSGSALPQVIDQDAPIFSVSVASELAGMHPQTLRGYDRMGLVVAARAPRPRPPPHPPPPSPAPRNPPHDHPPR